jgi:uncharacterized protein (TIGR02268 family)
LIRIGTVNMTHTTALLSLLLAEIPAAPRSSAVACQDTQRIELSRTTQVPPEVCVTPRRLTGFHFDAPVSVDLQDEARFEDVARGRTSVQLMPPKDMVPGERLRLSASYSDGRTKQDVVFILVATEDQATRQVEVFRDQRSREILDAELRQERAKNQRLLSELTRLRGEFEVLRERVADPPRLVGMILGLREDLGGYRFKKVDFSLLERAETSPGVRNVRIFRIASRVAFALKLEGGRFEEPQWELRASVWDERGEHVRVVHVQVDTTPSEDNLQLTIVEVEVTQDWPHGQVSLRLQNAASQGVTITGMKLP